MLTQEELSILELLCTSDEENINLAETLAESQNIDIPQMLSKIGYNKIGLNEAKSFIDYTIFSLTPVSVSIYDSNLPLPQSVKTLSTLGLSNYELKKYPPNIETIFIGVNTIIKMSGIIPNSVHSINCGDNPIKELPKLPSQLETLKCFNCNLKKLPDKLPDTMIYLSCTHNQIEFLPKILPKNLRWMNISYNPIVKLPKVLPPNLELLKLEDTKIAELPVVIPDNLRNLYLSNCNVSKLPDNLPPHLKTLHCINNKIEKFPDNMPSSLISLACKGNPIPPEEMNRLKTIYKNKRINIYF